MNTMRQTVLSLTTIAFLALSGAASVSAGETEEIEGKGAWRNGPMVMCEFTPGTQTVVGFLKTRCNPNYDRDCVLYVEVASIKKDQAREYLSHEAGRCKIKLADGPRNTLRPLWRASNEGELLVRVTGLVTDGVLTVTRGKVLSEGAGYR